jgi:hypothetical protein
VSRLQELVVEAVPKASVCSRTINTSFVERRHATDRSQNARKSRRSYRFSKDWEVHEAMTEFTAPPGGPGEGPLGWRQGPMQAGQRENGSAGKMGSYKTATSASARNARPSSA